MKNCIKKGINSLLLLLSEFFILLSFSFDGCAQAPTTLQTVWPVELHGVIKNPGMGYQTFHKTAEQDNQLPSSVMYCRYSWSAIQKGPVNYNFEPIDRDLAAAKKAGQRLAFRIMGFHNETGPIGLRDAGLPGFTFTFYGRPIWYPDLDQPSVQREVEAFIGALGQRYGNNPDIDHVDVGFIGDWGEQHYLGCNPAPPYPSFTTFQWLLKQFQINFNKPILENDGSIWWTKALSMFNIAIQSGAGWRIDGWGQNGYQYKIIVDDNPNAWQRAPVILEPAGVMADWLKNPPTWTWLDALQWAVENHASQFSNKSATIPSLMIPAVSDALTKIGYRFVLTQAQFPTFITEGSNFNLALKWINKGNSPMYFDRFIIIKMGTKIINSEISMRGFLPGNRTDIVPVRTEGLTSRHLFNISRFGWIGKSNA